jgi:hypothetical protein
MKKITQERKKIKLFFALIFVICIFVRIIPAFIVYGTEDVYTMQIALSLLEQGKDPYSQSYIFNQSPFWVNVIYEMSKFIKIFKVPYHMLIKIIPIISDAIISVIIYKISLNLNTSIKRAVKLSFFYALNPISIIITSIHGNLVPIPVCFLVISVYILFFYKGKYSILYSSLTLGIAIMSKIWPIFFLPVMLQKIKFLKNKLIYLIFSIIPFLISLFPLYLKNKTLVIDYFFKYKGQAGWWGFTGLTSIWNFPFLRSFSYFYANKGSLILCSVIMLLYLFKTYKMSLFRALCLISLAFFFFTPGFGPQYLVWILPFLILTKDKMFFPFTLYITALFVIEYWFRPFLGNIGTYINGIPPTMTLEELIRDNRLTNILRLPLWIFIGIWLSIEVFWLEDKHATSKN